MGCCLALSTATQRNIQKYTSVALHRISYLLYRARDLRRELLGLTCEEYLKLHFHHDTYATSLVLTHALF